MLPSATMFKADLKTHQKCSWNSSFFSAVSSKSILIKMFLSFYFHNYLKKTNNFLGSFVFKKSFISHTLVIRNKIFHPYWSLLFYHFYIPHATTYWPGNAALPAKEGLNSRKKHTLWILFWNKPPAILWFPFVIFIYPWRGI